MNIKQQKKRILSGLATGLVNGLFGGGGGMIAVPLCKKVLDCNDKQAHATAILIIAPVCAVGALTYIINGFADFSVIIPSAIGNVLGGIIGAKFLNKLPTLWVNIIFIIIMAVAGARMIAG
jgi:hypothetical protein